MRLQLSYIWLLLAAFTLTACNGCASMGGVPPAPKAISQSLVYAETTATAANQVAASLVTSKTISIAQGQQINSATTLVFATVQKSRASVAIGDAANAQAQLNAIAADLALLADFLAAHKTGAKP